MALLLVVEVELGQRLRKLIEGFVKCGLDFGLAFDGFLFSYFVFRLLSILINVVLERVFDGKVYFESNTEMMVVMILEKISHVF